MVKTENVPAGQSIGIGIAALERGIRWIPAYRIEPKGDPDERSQTRTRSDGD